MLLAAKNNPQLLSLLGYMIVFGAVITVFFIGLSISAAILKMACRTAGAEAPDTGRAMVVSFLESLTGGVAWVCSLVTVSVTGAAMQAERATMTAMVGFSAVAVAFVVPAGLYMPMLRVTFQKGLVIAILRYVITFAIVAVIAFAVVSLTGTGKFRFK
jgi:hypothetical protein